MTRAVELMTEEELGRLPREADAGFGALATARGHLPLEAMEVHARAVGLDVRTELRQTFANTLGEPIEATYIFPLPDRGAVTGFRLRVGERVVEGVIEERGAARERYDEALREGHRAAIAEEERPDVFTVRVGNLTPGQRATIELDLVGALAIERNEATFRFPLVVAPRYIPGQPLPGGSVGDGVASDTDAVPDASRISPPVLLPGYPSPVRLRLRVDIDPAGLPIARVRSSLHAVIESEGEGGRRSVELRPGERLDRDFVLRYALGDAAVRTGLVIAPDRDGEGGAFALTVLPPEGAGAARPRDVVLVLDRSGSMGGWKMVAARRAAARLIDSLNDADRLAVLAFDSSIETPAALPAGALAAASDRNRFRAVEFLAGVEARGGTEMAAPLLQAASLLGAGGAAGRDRVLVLVTDGQVGNEDQILRELAPALRGARVFPIGIDRAVNAGFLHRLADLGGAVAELVESEDRLDEVMARIQRRIGAPVVTELALAGDGLDIEPGSLAPARRPDLLAGAPVVLRGRVRALRDGGAIVLSGADAQGGTWRERVPARVASGAEQAAVSALWARAAIRRLEDDYAAGHADRGEVADRIVKLSLRHSVLSRFTAFVAIDRSEVVNPGGRVHRAVQAVEPASGWDMLAAEAAPAPGMVMAGFAPPPAPAGMAPAGAPPVMRAAGLARASAPPAQRMRRPAPKADAEARPVAPAEERKEGKEAAAASSVRDQLEAMRESLAARGGADPAAWAAAVLTLLDAILRAAPRALRAGLERLRAHLALVASGTAPDPAGALATIERELGELVALLDGRPRRRGAFWR